MVTTVRSRRDVPSPISPNNNDKNRSKKDAALFLAIVAACGCLTVFLNAAGLGGDHRMATVFGEEDGTYMEMKDKDCACVRSKSVRDSLVLESDTYPQDVNNNCGAARGSEQRVFSYVYFGRQKPTASSEKKRYFDGIALNAELIRKFRPDWTMRVYHNATSEEDRSRLCEAACSNDNLDLCDIAAIDDDLDYDLNHVVPTVWRFLPMADPKVSVAAFRDLDSLPSAREDAALQEWLDSKYAAHVMRDHPQHTMVMLAGMWGLKMDKRLHEVPTTRLFENMIKDPLSDYTKGGELGNRDQILLKDHIFKRMRDRILQHDSFTCKLFFGRIRPFPTRRPNNGEINNYVGAPFALNSTVDDSTPCPLECRPRRHKDWTTC